MVDFPLAICTLARSGTPRVGASQTSYQNAESVPLKLTIGYFSPPGELPTLVNRIEKSVKSAIFRLLFNAEAVATVLSVVLDETIF